MKFLLAEQLFSTARMSKYLNACNGDKRKAMRLYKINLSISQKCFGLISLFEIILRNAIDKHYREHYDDLEWIVSQSREGGILEHEANNVLNIKETYIRRGIYSNDKMTASFSFGFWTYLFTRRNFRLGGNSLLRIFPNRRHGLRQAVVYEELTAIRNFRNRIAHHEPICFDQTGRINSHYIIRHYQLINDYLNYLGISYNDISNTIELPNKLIDKINTMI